MKTPPCSMCVAFNGPPGIGKDTIAAMILKRAQGAIHSGTLSELIRHMAEKHYDYEGFVTMWGDREWKEAFCPILGMTRRQAIIRYSEDVVKPQHGADYFAEQFAAEMSKYPMSIMTDLGFDVEAHCLADRIDFNIVVQLHHPEFDFSSDSRSYVDVERDNVVTIKHVMRRGDPQQDADDINRKICLAFEDRYR